MLRRIALAALLAAAPTFASAQFATIGPTPPVTDNNDRLATTQWVNNFFALGIPLATGKIFIGSAGGLATAQSMSGDCTLAASGVITCTQAAGNFQVIGNLTVGGSVIDGNGILATNIAAPATPAAGTTRIYVDATQKVLTFKNDAGTTGNAVVPSTASTHQWASSISAAGIIGYSQPAIGDISGLGTGVPAWLVTPTPANLNSALGITVTQTIASGATAMGTGAISSAACATAVTATATGTATTDVATASFSGDPTAVTGYVPLTSGMLTIVVYPTANTVNFKVCNNTSSSITPGAITLNWRVVR